MMKITRRKRTGVVGAIYHFAKEKGIKISDIEEEAGVSKGYLSRFNQNESDKVPSLDVVIAASELLGVSIDLLVNYEPKEMTDREEYLLKLISKLKRDTIRDNLEWVVEKRSYLEEEVLTGMSIHPLFKPNPRSKRQITLISENEVQPAGDCFHAELFSSDITLYIMCVNSPGSDRKNDFEIYLYDRTEPVEQLCSTASISGEVARSIRELYMLIIENRSNINLSRNTRNKLDKYMAEELPF